MRGCRAKFITHVMSRAVAGGVLMILCVMSMHIADAIDHAEFGDYLTAMSMIALTFSGLVMLYRVCQPFNAYRLVLFLLMLAIAIVCIAVPWLAQKLYTDWYSLSWDYAKILVIVVVIEAAFPLSSALIKIMEIIMPSSTGNAKKQSKPANQK